MGEQRRERSGGLAQTFQQRGYIAHIHSRGEGHSNDRSPDLAKQSRRWVVERPHSWLTRSQRLLTCWEKLECASRAILNLARALLCFQQRDRYHTTAQSEKGNGRTLCCS